MNPIQIVSTCVNSRRGLPVLMAFVLAAAIQGCATPPGGTPESRVKGSAVKVVSAYDLYNTRDYPGAVREFDKIINGPGNDANSRRMAYLGKAMIYLGEDESWYSVDNAKLALTSAGKVIPDESSAFAVETEMLMDAVMDLVGTESELAALQTKSAGSQGEAAALRRERDALQQERDTLLKEQKALNEALEKLKNLTLGN